MCDLLPEMYVCLVVLNKHPVHGVLVQEVAGTQLSVGNHHQDPQEESVYDNLGNTGRKCR